jgi:hypothetical protein
MIIKHVRALTIYEFGAEIWHMYFITLNKIPPKGLRNEITPVRTTS